jgi:methylase of polypeptide subunit release factors
MTTPAFEPVDLTFRPNVQQPRHRWYPLTEGFSHRFVEKCLATSGLRKGGRVFDPFAGCGTTAVVAARLGYQGVFTEVNPLLAFATATKVTTVASPKRFVAWAVDVVHDLQPVAPEQVPMMTPGYPTLRSNERFGRWLYHDRVLTAVLPLVERTRDADGPYLRLLRLALARALEGVCNAKRDGKAMRYRRAWRDASWEAGDVKSRVIKALNDIAADLEAAPVEASNTIRNASVFEVLPSLDDASIDVCITSPPYLNSRDYTDLYNADMWLLGFISTYDEVRELRRSCVDSHMQLYGRSHRSSKLESVAELVQRFEAMERAHWLAKLPEMVSGYFGDMEMLIGQLARVIRPGGWAYLNVAESAYCGTPVRTLDLLADIGRAKGFSCEVDIVRTIRRSGQQFHAVESLREGVVRMRRP